jgi:uncharacterized Zn-finger protein
MPNIAEILSPENVQVGHPDVYCDGAGYGDGGRHYDRADIPAALGHPRVYLAIPAEAGFKNCPYCDRRFQYRYN